MYTHSLIVVTIGETLKAMQKVDAQITEQVQKGTRRDKHVIRTLQIQHKTLSTQYAKLVKPDRETPIDASDVSGAEFKKSVLQFNDTPEVANLTLSVANPMIQISSDIKAGDEVKPLVGDNFAYCQKCKTKRPIVNGVEAISAKGRRTLKGTCGTCSSKVFRFLKKN